MTAAVPARLPAYSAFAAMLAMAGLPIYIHAPKFYVDEFGVSLAALGLVLGLMRLVDVVQDPVLGWMAERLRQRRAASVTITAAAMGAAMIGLFAAAPPVAPVLWFALTLTVLFSGFSFLTITFYAQGVAKAEGLGGNGHVRLAAWRETGALIGVCLAAVAPTVLLPTGAPFAVFAVVFAVLALVAAALMRPEWRAVATGAPPRIAEVLGDRLARRLLLVALVNATPLAITSTLFLFFVESRLDAPGFEGPLLLLFFLSAAVSAPLWSRLAAQHGAKPVLLSAMALAIASFAVAAFLGSGDTAIFAAVCIVSGAAVGADLTLLPALFARRMAQVSPSGAQGFGLWSFASKATLAIAAVSLLPILQAAGFRSGGQNDAEALATLTILYAVVPCALKLAAIWLLYATDVEEG
ncbi:MFS transporter [Anianabacter salinae]|uniref:MFS transporter n=1 Tax=Anianabacter salinae TaxID=2851023 RepID=UPI00225E5128|nr:MFS transporter [Anianabacter salinae]MBV0913332.1 MFS transporter [Anianabacter salinae]